MARSTRTGGRNGCPSKPPCVERPLLDETQASALVGLFKVFANPTRLRLLHALVRAEELCVNDLAAELDMKAQAVSNQLQRLADKGIVAGRRNASYMLYRITDPCVPALLEHGSCLLEDAEARRGAPSSSRGARPGRPKPGPAAVGGEHG